MATRLGKIGISRFRPQGNIFVSAIYLIPPPREGGVSLGIVECGCAAGTLEPLAYTRASSSEFCYPILDKNPQIPPILE